MRQQDPKHEKKNDRQQPDAGRQAAGNDYWDRIARDVATGYGAHKGRDHNILNPDQEPDDARRGDS